MSIRLSMVSHGQAPLANLFLGDIARMPDIGELVITENVPQQGMRPPNAPLVRHTVNPTPLGFAENHNLAFQGCGLPYFCVANPDLRLHADPFPALLRAFDDPKVGLVAPLVLSPAGLTEDNARRFPTPWNLGLKLLGVDDGRYHLAPTQTASPQPIEWVAGMFLLFRTEAFQEVGGFDAKFHLYYEDVDICARLWRAGWKVVCDPAVTVVHDAQRASRHNPLYMRWHAASMARYFWKHFGRLPKVPD